MNNAGQVPVFVVVLVPLKREFPRVESCAWPVRAGLALGVVGLATLLRFLVDPLLHNQVPYFIYIAAVVVATWFTGVAGGLLGTLVAAFVGNYLFVAPRYEVFPHPEDWGAMAVFSIVAVGLVWLVARWKRAERDLQAQARTLHGQASELRALHAEAERVNRLKDDFLATLSHELRTPLGAILGWAHMLDSAQLDAEQRQRGVEAVLRNAHAQTRMIEDLLDVSRITSGKLHLRLETVDVPEIVRSAVDSVQPAARAKQVEIETRLAPGSLVVDADRLRQLVWNLLSNAVKFTPKEGRVEVRTERKDSSFILTVSDTGVGIAPDFLPFVFDRFSQEDSSATRHFGGLGLGLALVRHIAELHGGTVAATSAGQDAGPPSASRSRSGPWRGAASRRRRRPAHPPAGDRDPWTASGSWSLTTMPTPGNWSRPSWAVRAPRCERRRPRRTASPPCGSGSRTCWLPTSACRSKTGAPCCAAFGVSLERKEARCRLPP